MNRKYFTVVAVIILMILALSGDVFSAGVPGVINYQGRLTDGAGTPVPDNNYLIKFKIYGSLAGADSLWWSGFQAVAVAGGLFSYQLGSAGDLPNDLFKSDTIRYLGITVGVDPEISPRSRLISTPYSFKSIRSDTANVALVANDIASGIIVNGDINGAAAIAATKISGTAATLSADQTLTGDNTFDGATKFGDSTMWVSNMGISIGRASSPSSADLITVARDLSTGVYMTGIDLDMDNAGLGGMLGVSSNVVSSTAGTGGQITAFYGTATGDGGNRYGFHGIGTTQTVGLTTGNSYGLCGSATYGNRAYGVYGTASDANTNYAGYFSGNVTVTGTLSKGGGSFKIDHPLDPENKYLQHSFVESPDMMNIYNGNIVTDGSGYAIVNMPDYFGVLNMDFRYQLTVIGQFAQAIVAEEISGNQFKIQTDKPNIKVSWQVTGIRKDKWAEANRIQVEVDKKPDEMGKYLHPEVYNLPIERSVDYENIKTDVDGKE